MEPVASDAESLDIPGLVVGKSGAGVGLVICVSLAGSSSREPGSGWLSLFQCIGAGGVVKKRLHVRVG